MQNPVKQVRCTRADNGRVRMVSPDEEAQLLAQCAAHLTPLVSTVRVAYAKNGRAASYS
jgi:GTP cyclohydrolase I